MHQTTDPTFAQVFYGITRQLGPASNAQGPPGTGTPALCRRSLPSKLFEHLPPCLLDRTRGWPLEGKAAATLSSGTPQRFFMRARVQQWWLHATTLFARGSKGWLDFDVLYAHAGQLELWEQYARFSSQGDADVDRHFLLRAHQGEIHFRLPPQKLQLSLLRRSHTIYQIFVRETHPGHSSV